MINDETIRAHPDLVGAKEKSKEKIQIMFVVKLESFYLLTNNHSS